MTADVFRLTGAGPLIVGTPPQSVIELLEDVLERAKNGEVKGVGLFYIDGANTIYNEYASGCANTTHMCHGASRLWFRLMNAGQE